MAQLADAVDSKSTVRKDVRVRIPLRAPSGDPSPPTPDRSDPVPYPLPVAAPSPQPLIRQVRRFVLLGAAIAAVAIARDRVINEAERRDADVLGLPPTHD